MKTTSTETPVKNKRERTRPGQTMQMLWGSRSGYKDKDDRVNERTGGRRNDRCKLSARWKCEPSSNGPVNHSLDASVRHLKLVWSEEKLDGW